MKKNLFLLFLGCMVFSRTFAYTSLTSQEVKNYQSGGFIVSDNHTSYEVCNSEKQTNDEKYPSYNRSECFSESGTFKYFICDKTVNCSVVGSGVANTLEVKVPVDTQANTSKTTLSAKNKAQLDAFIKKLSSQKDKLSQEAYEKMLGDTLNKYEKLAKKYQKNKQVSDILNYLVEQTKILQSEIQTDDMTNFWCELDEDNCKNTTPPTLTQTGSVPKTATGKTRIPEEKVCTMEYAPVCGVDGNTYSNSCQAGDVVVKHKGACDKEVLSISSGSTIPQTPITKAQRDAFMEDVKKDLASRITEDKDFVYIDGELAITKTKYDHKNFGKTDDPYQTVSSEADKLVCPTGYEFARVKQHSPKYGYYSELDVSPLTLETLGYYVNQVANGERKLSSPVVSPQQKVNSLYRGGEIVDDKYRLTAKIYDGSFRGKKLQTVDVCTQEFGHQWQISTSQAGLDATKKIIKEKTEGYTGGDEYGNGMTKTTTIFYNEIWDTTGETLTKPNGNNCFSYQVVKDGYEGNYKSYTHQEGRYSWEDSTQKKLLKGAPVLKSCTEKAYVACEYNGKPDNYEETHLSFTGVRVLTSSSSGINPIKHISETGVIYWSGEMDDVKSTGFFVSPTNVNKNFGGSEQGTRYWSGRMQIMYFDLTKAGEDWKNPDAKYTTYNTRTHADFYQNSLNPVLCQKVGTQASKIYPQNIVSGDKEKFPILKNVDYISLQDYDYLYFQRQFRHNLDSNVIKYGQQGLDYANAFAFYRYRGRQFLLHTFEMIKNTELHIAAQEKTHKLRTPNFDYYIPIWDNGYYFPVSEKK